MPVKIPKHTLPNLKHIYKDKSATLFLLKIKMDLRFGCCKIGSKPLSTENQEVFTDMTFLTHADELMYNSVNNFAQELDLLSDGWVTITNDKLEDRLRKLMDALSSYAKRKLDVLLLVSTKSELKSKTRLFRDFICDMDKDISAVIYTLDEEGNAYNALEMFSL